MIYFVNDYQEGCIPEILNKMQEFNYLPSIGYGLDDHCERARMLIRDEIKSPKADVHFITGGTLTNKIVINSFLRSYEGVICADTAHIATHETGAIEHGGNKLLVVENHNGKICAEQIEMLVKEHIEGLSREHTVKPGMVYISQSTELGTVYTRDELAKISAVCKKYNLIFFIDGARILTSLYAKVNDCTLADISALCDVMYLGGTKAGALLGEALIINNDRLKDNFRYILKQNGALMAKGFVMGMQFEGLFENGNYKKYCKSAIECADEIRDALIKKGIALEIESCDTQTFAIFTRAQYESLASSFNFGGATIKGDLAYARICTSWATTKENVNALVSAIEKL